MRAALLFVVAILVAPWLVARWAEPIVYMENWPDGSPKRRAASVRTIHGDYVFDGPARSFHSGGQVESDGAYSGGKEQGPWKWYRADGSLLAEAEFEDGSGDYRSFHEDGSIWWAGRREDGGRNGSWIARDEQGRKIREGEYVRDRPHGEWLYWSYGDSMEHYSGRWEHGVLLEEDAPPSYSAELRLSWAAHGLEFGLWLLWMIAPWPLALALLGEFRGRALSLLAVLMVGLAIQLLLVQLALAMGLFRVPVLALMALGMLSGGVWLLRRRPGPLDELSEFARSVRPPGNAEALLMVAAIIVALTRLWTGLVEAATNFDALAYHLPFMADWIQSSGLVHRPEFGQVAYYAYGWEAILAAPMLLMRDDAFLAAPNLLAWLALLLACFVFARRLGASRGIASAAALLLLAAPEVLRRLVAVQPDLALAAIALSALVFAGYPETGRRAWSLPLLASCGLLLAVKMTGWVYLLAGILLVVVWRRSFRVALDRRGVLAAIASALVGLFWYVRNLFLSGNPLGDLQIALGPVILFDGSLASGEAHRGSLARVFEGTGDHVQILASTLQTSFGPVVWGGLACLLGLTLLVQWRVAPAQRVALRWMLVAWFVAAIIYWNTPYGADNGANEYRLTKWMANNTRFAFPAFLFLAPLLAHLLQCIGRWGLWLATLAVAAGAGWGVVDLIGPRYEVLMSAAAVGIVASLLMARARRVLLPAALVLIVLLLFFTHGGRELRQQSRLQLYGATYEYLLRNYPPEQRFGYAMTQQRYPFVGPRISHPVVSAVPLTEDRASWFHMLEHEDIDVLLVGYGSASESGRLNPENVRPWLTAADSPFELVSAFQSQRRDVEVWQRR